MTLIIKEVLHRLGYNAVQHDGEIKIYKEDSGEMFSIIGKKFDSLEEVEDGIFEFLSDENNVGEKRRLAARQLYKKIQDIK